MSWTVTGRRYLCMLAPCLSCDRCGVWDVMDCHRQEMPLYVGSVFVLWQIWRVRCHGLSQAGDLCRELVCITVKWTWYNGCDKFFHITSGRINTWKGVNQLKELIFLNLIFLNTYLKLTYHSYFKIRNPLFFHNSQQKWGFVVKF